jgi:hypothetical protein
MTARRQQAGDLDSPWKEALKRFLRPFLVFFFPRIHERIAWERGYQSLDKEVKQVVRGARLGRRLADKPFQVWDREGREAWLLIHIEIQGRRVGDFPEQLYAPFCPYPSRAARHRTPNVLQRSGTALSAD